MDSFIKRDTALKIQNTTGIAGLVCIVLSHLNVGYLLSDLSNSQSYISCLVILLFFVQLALLVLRSEIVRFNLTDLIVLIFYVYVLSNNLILGNYFFTTEFIDFTAVFCVYFLIRGWNKEQEVLLFYLKYTAVSIIGIESVYCLLQWCNIIPNLNPGYRVAGSFGHPAFTAVSISILLPYFIKPLKDHRAKTILVGTLIPFLFTALLLLLLESRSAVISIILSFGVIVIWNWIKNSRRLKIAALLIFSGSVLGIVSLIKSDSSMGRIFIWKKCMAIIPEHFLFGHGFGRFAFKYNEYQSSYFSKILSPDKESSLAEYCESAFSEFLQFGVEMGLAGLILLLMALGTLFYFKNKTAHAYLYNAVLLSYLPLFFGWSVLRYFPLGCFFFIGLGLLSKEMSQVFHLRINIQELKYLIFFLLFVSLLSFSFNRALFFEANRKIRDKKQADYAVSLCKVYNQLLYSDSYIYQYSAFLIDSNQYRKAEIVCENSSKWLNTPALYYLLFQIHFELKEYDKAQKDLDYLIHISPSKIYPRYALAKLYYDCGSKIKADSLAREILRIKPKIINADVILIREELKLALKNEVKLNAIK